MRILKFIKNPYISLCFNCTYAVGNCVVGLIAQSWWFITVGAYYMILTVARFCVLKSDKTNDAFTKRVTGILLLVLSLCLIGVNVLSYVEKRGTEFHEIVMIAIAAYTFTKITVAIIGLIKAKKADKALIITLRNISFADFVVSIYTLQRSMLVSFPGMTVGEIQVFNLLTGSAVFTIILCLGINLIGGKYVNMAKSKIVKANEKIAKTVSEGYKKIENGVTQGYKKIEKGVVDGYTKIEDKFVENYLTKDGEIVEEAKSRLKNQNK